MGRPPTHVFPTPTLPTRMTRPLDSYAIVPSSFACLPAMPLLVAALGACRSNPSANKRTELRSVPCVTSAPSHSLQIQLCPARLAPDEAVRDAGETRADQRRHPEEPQLRQ